MNPATAQSLDQIGAAAFLVERYLPAAAIDRLAESVARVGAACDESGIGPTQVRYLQSTYVPGEDTCFCLFRATSADAVRVVNAAANFAIDRITNAFVLFDCAPTTPVVQSSSDSASER